MKTWTKNSNFYYGDINAKILFNVVLEIIILYDIFKRRMQIEETNVILDYLVHKSLI